MSTSTLAGALESIFTEEGTGESAVVARFSKVAHVFGQYPDNSIADVAGMIKTDEVRRLALGGWLLHQYGVTKDNGIAVYQMARLGKPEVYRSVLKTDSLAKAKEAYKKAIGRLAKASQATRQEANTSGESGTAMLKSASRLDDASIILKVTPENDEAIKALEAVIKKYKALKTNKSATQSAQEPALV